MLFRSNKVAVYPVGEDEWMDMGQLTELREMETKLTGGGISNERNSFHRTLY